MHTIARRDVVRTATWAGSRAKVVDGIGQSETTCSVQVLYDFTYPCTKLVVPSAHIHRSQTHELQCGYKDYRGKYLILNHT
jgi:hypothetical protein